MSYWERKAAAAAAKTRRLERILEATTQQRKLVEELVRRIRQQTDRLVAQLESLTD